MDNRKKLYLRTSMFLLFIVLLPSKYFILFMSGHEIVGKVLNISSNCTQGVATKPQPRITVAFSIDKVERVDVGEAGYGNPDFCDLKVGDSVKVQYYEVPHTRYVIDEVGDVKERLLISLLGGIFLNIVGNLSIAISSWNEKRRLKKRA